MVIDPGAEGPRISEHIDRKGYRLETIVATHGHVDHIGAIEHLRSRFRVNVAIHCSDAGMLADPFKNLSGVIPGYAPLTLPPADTLLKSGDSISVGTVSLKVMHTPGHTPGSICLIAPGVMFSGDTLFHRGVGTTDLPGGDYNRLRESLQVLMSTLDDEVRVYPGHGQMTTVGEERCEIGP